MLLLLLVLGVLTHRWRIAASFVLLLRRPTLLLLLLQLLQESGGQLGLCGCAQPRHQHLQRAFIRGQGLPHGRKLCLQLPDLLCCGWCWSVGIVIRAHSWGVVRPSIATVVARSSRRPVLLLLLLLQIC